MVKWQQIIDMVVQLMDRVIIQYLEVQFQAALKLVMWFQKKIKG